VFFKDSSVELQHQGLYGTGNVEGAVAHLQGVLLYGLLVIRLDGLLQILALVLDEYVLAGEQLEGLARGVAGIRGLKFIVIFIRQP